MQAAVYSKYGDPDVLEIREIPKPVPGDNEILIKIRAAAVASEDCTFRKGRAFAARAYTGFARPRREVLGTQLSGEVEEAGREVSRFQPGDRLFASSDDIFGAHAEYICLPEDGAIAGKPDNISWEEAAALPSGALTALAFLRDEGKVRRGQQVLVNGASGSVGSYGVQLGRHFGAEVTGVCSGVNLELVKSLGANRVIDYTKEDFTRIKDSFDIVFDSVGKSSFSRCKGILKPGGVYLSTVLSPGIVLQTLWTRMAGGKRAKIALTGLRPTADKARDLDLIGGLVVAGEIRAVIDRTYPLEQAAEAHRHVETGHKKGNVVLVIGGSDGNPA